MDAPHRTWIAISSAALGLVLVAGLLGAAGIEEASEARRSEDVQRGPTGHVPEVRALLEGLTVEKPRTHENMVVFPIRWRGQQAPGKWLTLDDALASGKLAVTEQDQASVPSVRFVSKTDRSVFLMSGEIIAGGKQTRVIRSDTVIEARQEVAVAVFCVERSRWAGSKTFARSGKIAPSSVQGLLKSGGEQGAVWESVRHLNRSSGAGSATESLDEVMRSDKVEGEMDRAHKSLGKFSPPDTIGLAVGDTRTGRIVGLELFGRRDLFEQLQAKLVEGYTMDLVVVGAKPAEGAAAHKVTARDVEAFIALARRGTSRYEDTEGSGRGIDLESGTLRGKGVALGAHALHLSVQDLRPGVTPARPRVTDPELPPVEAPPVHDTPQPEPYREPARP
jgi:hypothetical protein